MYGFYKTAFVGLATSGDVEGRAVVDRCANDGEAKGDVDAEFEAEDLDGAVPLVVVDGDHDVEFATLGEEEEGIGGEWANDIPSAAATGLDGGNNLGGFFAPSEETILAGVWIDATDPHTRFGDATMNKRGVSARDRALDQAGLDLFDGVE